MLRVGVIVVAAGVAFAVAGLLCFRLRTQGWHWRFEFKRDRCRLWLSANFDYLASKPNVHH